MHLPAITVGLVYLQDGSTALSVASENGRVDVVRELLRSGAQLNHQTQGVCRCLLVSGIQPCVSVISLTRDTGQENLSARWL